MRPGPRIPRRQLRLKLRRIELVYLLVDRDGFEEEAILRIVRGDLAEDFDRFVVAVDADPEVADAVEGVDVVGVVLEESLVLLDRSVNFPLRDELLRVGDNLISLNRHLPQVSRTAASARQPLRMIVCVSGWARMSSELLDALPSRTPGDV